MDDSRPFGQVLKHRRQLHGLTQEALAELVGCAPQTVRKIEGGQRRPSFQMAERMGQVLKVPLEERPAWMQVARARPEHDTSQEHDAPHPTPSPLPVYLTPFIGREQELADLQALLDTPGCRLVTVLGPGGAGKTRLSLEIARRSAAFTGGVAFASLAPVAAPQAIVSAIGEAAGLEFSGSAPLATQLLGYLQDRRVLLVLDNLEHLLDPAGTTLGLLAELLEGAPGVTLLVTSRERLRLPGEWVLEMAGLPAPPDDLPPAAGSYPAITLFVEQARRARHTFHLTAENYAAVAAICRLVGGMPLGIELAATWVRLLDPAEIAAELARNLATQHLSSGTLPERHHSLQAVVEHSWRLVSEAERQALRRLAVFQGGFDREAAADVAGASLPVLADLADKSLLRRGADGRYDLHELIRQYGAAQLAADPAEYAATYDRHAAYYMQWLDRRELPLQGARQGAVEDEIGAEIDNIRAAWQWSLRQGHVAALVEGVETLQWFFEFRGWFQEGAELFGTAAETLQQTLPNADAAQRHGLGRLLGHYTYLLTRRAAFTAAHKAVTQSITLLDDGAEPVALAKSLMYRGMLLLHMGDYAQARLDLQAGLTLVAGDDQLTFFGESWSAVLAHAVGDYAAAEALFRSALARARRLGSPHTIVFCLAFYTPTLVALGQLDEAERLLSDGLDIATAAEDRGGTATVLQQLGLVALAQGTPEEASDLFREALALFRTNGDRSSELARTLNHLGAALLASGDQTEAGQVYRESFDTAQAAEATPDALQALVGLATYHERAGRPAAALALAARVLSEPGGRSETQAQAAQLQTQLRAHFSPEHADQLEADGRKLSVGSLVAE